MSKMPIMLAGMALLTAAGHTQAGSDVDAIDPPPCDPRIQDCCPVYDWFFTIEMRHWWACVPDVGTGGGPRDA